MNVYEFILTMSYHLIPRAKFLLIAKQDTLLINSPIGGGLGCLERASHHRLVLLALKWRLFIQTHCVETPQGGVADGLHGLLREPGLDMEL